MKNSGSDYRAARLVLHSPPPSQSRFLSFRPGWPHISLLAALVFCFTLTSPSLRAQTSPYTGMVSFGDSLTDGGNMNYTISVLGERAAQYLTGFDPNYYYDYRFSNGPVWVDRLYTSLGFGAIGTMRSNDGVNDTNGTNFAWAGSRSGTGTYAGFFPNLRLQVSNYSIQLANSNPALPAPATTLFTIWSGANDVFAHVESGGSDGITPQNVADNIFASITSLYGDGGRYFLVPNLPRIGDTPGYIDDPVKRALANAFVDSYNGLLDSSLDALSGSLVDITIIKLDINQLFIDIMGNPALYGFTNVTDPAYIRFGDQPYEPRDPPYGTIAGDSDGYFYWDLVHGTALTNSIIGDAAYHAVVPEPATAALVFGAGLALFALGRNRRPKVLIS